MLKSCCRGEYEFDDNKSSTDIPYIIEWDVKITQIEKGGPSVGGPDGTGVSISLKEGRGGLYHLMRGGKESCPRGEYTRDTR